MKRIICSVTNDLNYDQRMQRICNSLVKGGYEVTLVGRQKRNSPNLTSQAFNQKRLKCFFQKGKLFYLEYNLRLFIYLLFAKYDIVCSIDVDSILGGYMMKLLRGKKFVFDAHEYFTELEEVVNRPFTKNIWKFVEKLCIRNIDAGYTISQGYSDLYKKNLEIHLDIIRNITVLKSLEKKNREYILYQGAVNYGRGLEQLMEAMKKVNCNLVICGEGDIYEQLRSTVNEEGLSARVEFRGYLNPEELRAVTNGALIGITLFAADGLSNKYSLCNRFFDYMHCGVPQLAMNYPEYVKFNNDFEVSYLIEHLNPDEIAKGINLMLSDKSLWDRLHLNALEARQQHNWEKEEQKLLEIYHNL